MNTNSKEARVRGRITLQTSLPAFPAILLLLTATLLLPTFVLQAGQGPEVFFGQYVSPYPYDLARTVPRPTNLTAVAEAAARFYSRLLASGTEDFEQYLTNTSPSSLHFGSATADVSGAYSTGGGITDPTVTVSGVFPYSGTNYPVEDHATRAETDELRQTMKHTSMKVKQ